MPRLFLGNLGYDCRQHDIERVFRGYGELKNLNLKGQFGFLEVRGFGNLVGPDGGQGAGGGGGEGGQRAEVQWREDPGGAGQLLQRHRPAAEGRGRRQQEQVTLGGQRHHPQGVSVEEREEELAPGGHQPLLQDLLAGAPHPGNMTTGTDGIGSSVGHSVVTFIRFAQSSRAP